MSDALIAAITGGDAETVRELGRAIVDRGPAPEGEMQVIVEIRELDEDAFRTTESLGIDLSRPERGTDEEDAASARI